MSFTFDPYKLRNTDLTSADDVLMTNPTALTELEDYWSRLPRTKGVPDRSAVDPGAMGTLLEDSFILERVAPGVARIRVAGRNIAKLLGVEPRGLPLTTAMLPNARIALSSYLEAAFSGPSIVELPLVAPRAVGQPELNGKILLLPLRDNHGTVTRILGALVMSGRRGIGGRRFEIGTSVPPRVQPVVNLRAVDATGPLPKRLPSLRSVAGLDDIKKAKDVPALRLVVSNDR